MDIVTAHAKKNSIKNVSKIFLQTKIKETNSSYKSALKMSFSSLSLSSVDVRDANMSVLNCRKFPYTQET